ncbi:serine dehydratase subunit alpha family protein [Methanobacterium alcaliphilum]|uniref:L-cysteine desulfidase family protein n=1 Tax=Methanobacterium alcaliphilum TaxID=392018 RepID=UPI002009FB8B|nr:L-serine ammonia-lyase, iron-sulfur-dependent, subunit alpha [Methanobacterium alcaliphilum]MCK9150599.1 L-serine ammonia-lyase, iron-sulfur-dependent, subunit alpha [Methanobacterium alcaliphilum]
MEENKFIDILERELVTSLGCTEPISIAYAVALACKYAGGGLINKVKINASRNLIKNAMSVTIPGTHISEINLSSAYLAAALGIIKTDIEKNLEILEDLNKTDIEKAKELLSEGIISINLHDSQSKLFLEVITNTSTTEARIIIENTHTNVISIEVDGKSIEKTPHLTTRTEKVDEDLDFLDINTILEFIQNIDISKLNIIKKSIKINKKICKEGLKNSYGLQVGKSIELNKSNGFFSDDILSKVIAYTAAGSDARMSGCKLPAMSNSGSGNQGISATMPIVVVCEEMELPMEKEIRAVALSNLITIFIKSRLGRLSAVCGATISAMGACCGITYLLGGGRKEIDSSLQIMMANITGMICDGAKSGCALKISTCTFAAIHSSLLALNGTSISCQEGIIECDSSKTIENFCKLANNGMLYADKLILEMMLQKTYS